MEQINNGVGIPTVKSYTSIIIIYIVTQVILAF